MISTIFLIETNRFLSRALELAFKEQGVSCYTTESILDCFYLIRDLHPQVIIIGATTLIPHEEIFFNSYLNDSDCSKIPLILLGDENVIPEIKHKDHFKGTVLKPISPFDFKSRLEEILKSVP